MPPQSVAVIYGGTNTEHEVSIVSARSICQNLNPELYKVTPLYISKTNQWFQVSPDQLPQSKLDSPINPWQLLSSSNIDVVFPVLHGPYGEDGTLQGFLDTLHLPYVGCHVLASALCMDKVVQKQLCQPFLPLTPFTYCHLHEWQHLRDSVQTSINQLKYPLFIKPANQGSSVGVSKVKDQSELNQVIEQCFHLDTKVIIEQAVNHPREFEVAILGNHHNPKASIVGEIISSNEFYDYNAKYVDGKSQSKIPADIPKQLSEKIQDTAIRAYRLLNCSGLARVDFLYDPTLDMLFLNELNTMPGFTSISMYPKLWEASGISYADLLTKLINLAIKYHQENSQIQLSYTPKLPWYQV